MQGLIYRAIAVKGSSQIILIIGWHYLFIYNWLALSIHLSYSEFQPGAFAD